MIMMRNCRVAKAATAITNNDDDDDIDEDYGR